MFYIVGKDYEIIPIAEDEKVSVVETSEVGDKELEFSIVLMKKAGEGSRIIKLCEFGEDDAAANRVMKNLIGSIACGEKIFIMPE